MDASAHYYEVHCIVGGPLDDEIQELAQKNGFWWSVLEVETKKNEEEPGDIILTTRAEDEHLAQASIYELAADLRDAKRKLKRYKVESAVLDSKIMDDLELLPDPRKEAADELTRLSQEMGLY